MDSRGNPVQAITDRSQLVLIGAYNGTVLRSALEVFDSANHDATLYTTGAFMMEVARPYVGVRSLELKTVTIDYAPFGATVPASLYLYVGLGMNSTNNGVSAPFTRINVAKRKTNPSTTTAVDPTAPAYVGDNAFARIMVNVPIAAFPTPATRNNNVPYHDERMIYTYTNSGGAKIAQLALVLIDSDTGLVFNPTRVIYEFEIASQTSG